MSYDGFNLTVASVMGAMLCASALSAYFFAPVTTHH